MRLGAAALVVALAAGAAPASSPASWAASARAGRDACNKASGLRSATAVGPIIFSDAIGRDAFLVRGTYPQRFMKGASGAMLCLVDRRTHKAEVSEAKGWSAHP